LRASKSRLSKDAPTRGQPIGVGDADPSGPKAGDYYHADIFSTEADPRQRNLNGGDWHLTVMHPCCTYDGRTRSVRKTAALIVTIKFYSRHSCSAMLSSMISHRSIYHPHSTLTEAEIEVRAVQSTGPRVLIRRRRSL
jgi:hypothetical protein